MPAELLVPLEIQEAATRITRLTEEETYTIIPVLVGACRALSPRYSAIDLVLALDPSVCRRLESVATQHFQQQLRPRSDKTVPRAITEMRSASKAWGMSPLVLLVEFSDAPTSDNFWRILSKLARTGSDWQTVRERLYSERRRRQHDPLARRKGVSYSQPWAIPDIEAVLREEQGQPRPDREVEEQTRRERGSGEDTPLCLEIEPREISTDAFAVHRSVQPTVWRLVFGWWLSDDHIHQLCTSFVQLQPQFAVVDQRAINSTSTAPVLRTAPPTLIAPLYIKTASHWVLAIISRCERIISLYDCIPSHQAMDPAITTVKEICIEALQGDTFTPSDWAIVARSCPPQQSGADCSFAIVVFALYFLVGRAMPLCIDLWLWRRMFTCFLSRVSSTDAEQRAKEVKMAADMAEQHTQATTAERRDKLCENAMEAKATWSTAADLAKKAETDAQAERERTIRMLQNRRHALELIRKEPKVHAENDRNSISSEEEALVGSLGQLERDIHAVDIRIVGVLTMKNAIDAVLEDLDGLVAYLVQNPPSDGNVSSIYIGK